MVYNIFSEYNNAKNKTYMYNPYKKAIYYKEIQYFDFVY
jgi:hypothetical protein